MVIDRAGARRVPTLTAHDAVSTEVRAGSDCCVNCWRRCSCIGSSLSV